MNECAVCGKEIRPADAVVAQKFDPAQYGSNRLLPTENPLKAAGFRYWIHVGCTKDGVERWCRAGRPAGSPLKWIRSQGLNWTGLQGQAERGRLVLD